MRVKLLKATVIVPTTQLSVHSYEEIVYNLIPYIYLLQAKHGQRKKGWKDPESEKNCSVQASDPAAGDEEHHDDKPDEEVGFTSSTVVIILLAH